MKKEYKLQDGRTAVFEYDANGVGKITVEAMDYLIDMLPKWIPCSERLPDQNGKYLVVGRKKAINILKFDGGRWYGKWGVLAWRPLPEPYREEVSD